MTSVNTKRKGENKMRVLTKRKMEEEGNKVKAAEM